jgi:hypothetical protein
MEAGQIKKGGWVLLWNKKESTAVSTAVSTATASYFLGGVYFEYKCEYAEL